MALKVINNVSSLAGSEFVELYGSAGSPAFKQHATVNQVGATAFTQGSTTTATASAGAATANGLRFTITSESVTTAAGADYTLTLTNSSITATSIILATVANGTNTTEGLAINRVQPGSGSAVIHVRNTHASAALNGTIVINGAVLN